MRPNSGEKEIIHNILKKNIFKACCFVSVDTCYNYGEKKTLGTIDQKRYFRDLLEALL